MRLASPAAAGDAATAAATVHFPPTCVVAPTAVTGEWTIGACSRGVGPFTRASAFAAFHCGSATTKDIFRPERGCGRPPLYVKRRLYKNRAVLNVTPSLAEALPAGAGG